MRVELTQIDMSPIGELVRIRKEEAVLEERLAKMEEKNPNVSPVVYTRVKSDYEARRNELARGSQPFKEKALREYQRLKVLRAEVERAVEQVSLEKEELELRKALGEFPEDEFTRRLADCEKRLAEERRQLEDVLQMRNTFVAAFRSEEELESGTPQPGPAPAVPLRPAPPPPEVHAPPAPAPRPSPPPAPFAPPPPPPYVPPAPSAMHDGEGLTPDGTVIAAARPTSAGPRAAFGPAAPADETPAARPPQGTTDVLPRARLSLLEGDQPVKEFLLKAGASFIGRLVQSDIQIPSPDVSRRHAEVTVGADGCFIADLGSENGIVVNGHRVERHKLQDGDVIVLGKQRLIFRS